MPDFVFSSRKPQSVCSSRADNEYIGLSGGIALFSMLMERLWGRCSGRIFDRCLSKTSENSKYSSGIFFRSFGQSPTTAAWPLGPERLDGESW